MIMASKIATQGTPLKIALSLAGLASISSGRGRVKFPPECGEVSESIQPALLGTDGDIDVIVGRGGG